MNRKQLGWLLIGGGIVMIALVLLLSSSRVKEEELPTDNKMAEMMSDVPDAENKALPESKTEAYESFESKESKVNDYWDNCEEVYEQKKAEKDGQQISEKSTAELFGQDTGKQVQKTPPAGSNPYRETPEQREARHRRSREEAVRMAQEMNGVMAEDTLQDGGITREAPVRISTATAVVKRSSIISSLDSGWESGGISSLDSEDEYFREDEQHPFRCMFAKDSKIKNGQRVSVILQEDIVVSGTLVPRNTHIMASCKLSDRLELELTNIEIGGRILALGYEAYDVDGNRGIYCPDVGTTGRQARSSGRNLISSRLSGLMGGLARDVVSTGVSLIQNKDGEMTVSVPAGYTFFIIKKKDLNR